MQSHEARRYLDACECLNLALIAVSHELFDQDFDRFLRSLEFFVDMSYRDEHLVMHFFTLLLSYEFSQVMHIH